MDNVEQGRSAHGVRVAVPAGDDGHALLWFAHCPDCQATVNADRGFLADCWNCGKPLPTRFNSRTELHVEWALLDDIRSGRYNADEWHCTYCGTATPMSDPMCGKCKRSKHATGT
ncbi:hypothetical protein [Streptomonospora salina]|uniref:Putative nucleic acid-binding Zn ribbon protein n=1 Tax=Streptomonospora salina TaxID=104205 RepID=A0A841E250_9ACTN|nr:hypothetical protein [Streptomonospora salina]MBB5997205.1 putative nucleic acid-binding Zn ribbon protein [Streptomonospora salina]